MSEDDFSPMMGAIFLLFLCVALVLIGIGVVVGLVWAACTAMMVALGMLSTSVLLALLRRQVSTGFRVLHYQAVILGGMLSGVGAAWVGAGSLQLPLRQRFVLLIGLASGGLVGTLAAVATDYAARLAYRRWSESSKIPKVSGRADE